MGKEVIFTPGNIKVGGHSFEDPPPLIGILDFETIPELIEEDVICANHRISYLHCKCSVTRKLEKLNPLSYGFVLINRTTKKVVKRCFYRQSDPNQIGVAEHFVDSLYKARLDLANSLYEIHEKKIFMTRKQKREHATATKCAHCRIPFNNQRHRLKVKHHNHYAEHQNFIKTICSTCNLKIQGRRVGIPIYCHNFTNFDSNILIPAILDKFRKDNINVISKNSETVSFISCYPYKFMDSCSFLKGSLSEMIELLKEGKTFKQKQVAFPYIADMCRDKNGVVYEKLFNLLLAKNVFPYDYLNSLDKFSSTSFPEYEDFYNTLTEQNVSITEYENGKAVFNSLCTTMNDYLELYNMLDVLTLACCWLDFSDKISEKLNLYPEHFVSLPSMAFEAAKRTIQLQNSNACLIQNIPPKMSRLYFDVLRNIRGGVVFSNKKFAISSDFAQTLESLATKKQKVKLDKLKDNKSNENTHKQEEELFYFDKRNLYGHSLSQPLPYGDYSMLSEKLVAELNQNLDNPNKVEEMIPKFNPPIERTHTGYMLNVDIKYIPEYLSSFPPASSHCTVSKDELSPLTKELFSSLNNGKSNIKIHPKKHLLTMKPKSDYLMHYENFKYLLSLGVKLHINYGYSFKQAPIFEAYIKMCSKNRKESTSAIMKRLWKDIANVLYGKCIENILNHTLTKFISSKKKFRSLMKGLWIGGAWGRVHVENVKILNEKLVQVSLEKKNVKAENPVAIGFSVLEASKLEMLKTYWGDENRKGIHTQFKDRCQLVYSDTDSLILSLKSSNIADELQTLNHLFDFSNLDADDVIRKNLPKSIIKQNEGVVGKLKSETGSNRVQAVCILRKKCYSYIVKSTKHNSTNHFNVSIASKSLNKNKLAFQNFINSLVDSKFTTQTNTKIRKKDFIIFKTLQRTKALSSYDDNFFVKSCGLCTIPFSKENLNNYICNDKKCKQLKLYVQILQCNFDKFKFN